MGVMLVAALLAAAPAQEAAQVGTEAPGEQKICRRAKTTGSRVKVAKTCKTRAEWEASDAQARRDVESGRTMMRPGG